MRAKTHDCSARLNFLIALFDAAHVHHQQAHQWLVKHRSSGWATCPLTQNACIRILSQPAYPGRLPVADIARRLRNAIAASDHHFIPDSISLCDPALFDHGQILTPRHLTDLYLLALSASHNARLITFDKGIPAKSVLSAKPKHLLVL